MKMFKVDWLNLFLAKKKKDFQSLYCECAFSPTANHLRNVSRVEKMHAIAKLYLDWSLHVTGLLMIRYKFCLNWKRLTPWWLVTRYHFKYVVWMYANIQFGLIIFEKKIRNRLLPFPFKRTEIPHVWWYRKDKITCCSIVYLPWFKLGKLVQFDPRLPRD